MLLGNCVYNAIKKKPKQRPKSSMAINKNGYYYESGGPLWADVDPEEFIKIHTTNREGTGKRIVSARKEMFEEIVRKENDKKKKTLKGTNFPVFEGSMEDFEKEIRNYVIENTLYEDSDFENLKHGLIKQNLTNTEISTEQINEIVENIKKSLDDDDEL